ncbi:hypothetical protein SPBR_05962 [Sporothrix brasiliensis 5110]|uniref:Protein kinase domain-containing protein n=1 Tax=Sporothrix brasiliensis 5110 TaxID=1398154 RepID=A0A0C2JC21_9PEZI|nr:uncharacterized protein SPBR_05962 [Sporothrix brasiliensis 5110]KIH94457.1 hypothetical protein SPBR_05962 [Sporothrix brasiliensis 5110]
MENEIKHETHSPSGSSDTEDDFDGNDFDGDDYDGDNVDIIQLHFGDEFEADIMLLFNDELISITVLAPLESKESSIEKRVVDLISQISVDTHNTVSTAILDIIQPAGEEEFRRVAPKAPAPSPHQGNSRLHSLLYPKTHYFAFRREAPDTQPKIVPMSLSEVQDRWAPPSEDYVDGSVEEIQSLLSRLYHFPRYTTNDINVIEEILSGGTVTRVRVVPRNNGDDVDSHDIYTASNDLLCKATEYSAGLIASPTLRRELECLLALHEHKYQASTFSAPAESMRVFTPRLVGLVTHPENQRIVGFVREWISGERLSNVLKREKRGKRKPLAAHHKQRWARQLRASVDALHALGLVWGDGKTGNLIVGVGGADDLTGAVHGEEEAPVGDLWLIDFGGGWTNGWVDSDKENTIQGDEQAVQKILGALRI